MIISDLFKDIDLNINEASIEIDGWDTLIPNYDFEILPEEFLELSEADLVKESKGALINSLTNAKRGIDCQVDMILSCYGYKFSRMKIYDKFDLINSLGITAPRIIQKVRNQRNLLEHEYKNPKYELVEEAVDISLLFIGATNYNLNFYPSYYYVQNPKKQHKKGLLKNCFYVDYNREKYTISIRFYDSKEVILRKTIKSESLLFPILIRLGNYALRNKCINTILGEMLNF
ncbi:MAG: hypothetical protein CVU92_03445 [Firmicutes bacterium HGW-Firmicutes-17]|jgi:hypothetical protein|nr:MAG: hypothetical protein CVU92_03445 [Firmicutes bacterium HGW-Firmicutes-17]